MASHTDVTKAIEARLITQVAVTKAIRRAFGTYRRSLPFPTEGTEGRRTDARAFIVAAAFALGLDDGDLHRAWRRMREVKR